MSIFQKAGRALQAGIGITLFAVLATSGGTARAADQSDDESTGVAEEAVRDSGIFRCTIGGGGPGYLIVQPDPDSTCRRATGFRPGASNRYCFGGSCPSCWTLARDLECFLQN